MELHIKPDTDADETTSDVQEIGLLQLALIGGGIGNCELG